jgi:phosphinothricin acetyltransferase
MSASQMTVRRGSLADLPQCCAIFNHYILKTLITFNETPISLVDFVDRYRIILELGYAFFVIVYQDAPHRVVGFYYTPFGYYRWIVVPNLPSATLYLIAESKYLGLAEKAIHASYRQLVHQSDFRGIIGMMNKANAMAVRKFKTAFGKDVSTVVTFPNGAHKFGKYQNVMMFFVSKQDILNHMKPEEHL